jgi:hypothetical protein
LGDDILRIKRVGFIAVQFVVIPSASKARTTQKESKKEI